MLAAQELGMEFHIAGNWSYLSEAEKLADEERYGIKIHQIDFIRAPYHPKNKKAHNQLKDLVKREKYDAIHCNTPIGGVLGRIVGKQCKVKKVIYQVHGFHFYKGAPRKNWLLYYPIERWLSRHTDALITINHEDYELAKSKFKLRNGGNIYYVPGVGIDTAQYAFDSETREKKRAELNIPEDAFVLVSVGELNTNKNNRVIISAMEKLNKSNLHYVLCGVGDQELNLKNQAAKSGLQDNVHFLGYRTDVKEIYAMADCFVMPSFREGLSRSIMEAMASGLPCVVSKIRGNVDLVKDGEGGFLCDASDADAFADAINKLSDNDICSSMALYNKERIEDFGIEAVVQSVKDIYQEVFQNK